MAMRVAWFGHAGGRRADGLTAYSDQTVAGLVAAGCEVRFFHHDQDGDRTPVADAVALEGVRFKTVTLPAPAHPGADRAGSRGVPSRRRPLLSERLPPRRRHRPGGAWPRCRHGGDLPSPLRPRPERAGSGDARPLPVPQRPPPGVRPLHRPLRRSARPAGPGGAPARPDRGHAQRRRHPAHLLPGPSALRPALGAALVVSFLGRLDPEKRVEELIHSFVARRWPADHLLRHRRQRQPGPAAPRPGRPRRAGPVPGHGDPLRGPPGAAPGIRHLRAPLDRRGPLAGAAGGDGGGLRDHLHRRRRARGGAGRRRRGHPRPSARAGSRRGAWSGCAPTRMPGGASARPPAGAPSRTTAWTATSTISSVSTRARSRPAREVAAASG